MMQMYSALTKACQHIQSSIPFKPKVGLILGTGLGNLAELFTIKMSIPYSQIPHFPISTVEGHEGSLLICEYNGLEIIVMKGRFHYYEGYTLPAVTFPVRVMKELGAEYLIINSACGGLNEEHTPGDILLVKDHINLIGDNPLRGSCDARLGDRFPDMSRPYDGQMLLYARAAAQDNGCVLHEGVYAAVAGPCLETRAETRMLKILGADVVGMSTVPEVIVACQVGFKTMVIAAITNVNIPERMEPVSLQQVIHNAGISEEKLVPVVSGVLDRIRDRNA